MARSQSRNSRRLRKLWKTPDKSLIRVYFINTPRAPKEVTDEYLEAIKHNFIPLYKSITGQTKGRISRETFTSEL